VNEFTHILERVEHGDPKAAGELLPIFYEEFRRLTSQKMVQEGDQLFSRCRCFQRTGHGCRLEMKNFCSPRERVTCEGCMNLQIE
jgi:hypothetical protein